MNNNEKISIIVPIYNVEEYLPRCLDSIISQTYRNIEILLIDDESPDKSADICDLYLSKDERIKVFHIENRGVAKARQLGVESSTGEYIVFVDPDDSLPLNSIETLYSHVDDQIDLVIGSHIRHKRYNSVSYNLSAEEFDRESYIERVIGGENSIYPRSPWAKLISRSLFNNVSFPAVKRGQDWLMNIEISLNVNRVKQITDEVYDYYVRSNSTMNTFRTSYEYETIYTEFVYNLLKKNNLFDRFKSAYLYFAYIRIFHTLKSIRGTCPSTPWFKQLYEISKNSRLSLKIKIIRQLLRLKTLQYIYIFFREIYVLFVRLCRFIERRIRR